MREFVEKLISKLNEEKQSNPCRNTQCKDCTYTKQCYEGEQSYKVGVDNIIEIVNKLAEEYNKGWILLTDDEESYPTPFEYVLVEDEFGDKNVACCYPDYDWHISNGENSLKLNGNVVKWKKLSD